MANGNEQLAARKKAVRNTLFQCAKKAGVDGACAMAERLLGSKQHHDDFDFVSTLHGEICETVLELKLLETAWKYPKATNGWVYNKSLIVKDRFNVAGGFCTEIDLVLFTHACIYLFECKSYSGDKKLTGSGLLKRTMKASYENQLNTCDVYKQSKLHLDTFTPWVEDFVLPGKIPLIQMCIFDFSLGALSDERSSAAKLELPCLDEGNVADYILASGEVVWDLNALRIVSKKLDAFSAKTRDKHLAYVKNLHGKG